MNILPNARVPRPWISSSQTMTSARCHARTPCNVPRLRWSWDSLLHGEEGLETRRIKWEPSMFRPRSFSRKLGHSQWPLFFSTKSSRTVQHSHHFQLMLGIIYLQLTSELRFFLDYLVIEGEKPPLESANPTNASVEATNTHVRENENHALPAPNL